MKTVILDQTSKILFFTFLIVSLFVLYRGHNLPGGGFIGGLIAASAFAMLAISHGVQTAEKALKITPQQLIAVGLLIALLSGMKPGERALTNEVVNDGTIWYFPEDYINDLTQILLNRPAD